jgi:plasmid stabilization system protein ParE
MTRYTVVWVDSAKDELAEVWMSSADREAVVAATQAIDGELAQDATTRGDELSEGLRSLFVPPLKVIFVVREPDRIVEILRVRSL